MTSNQAAWYTEAKAKSFTIDTAPVPTPDANEVIIQNHAVAVNPVDWKICDSGAYINNYPNVLGEDAAGEIIEVGSAVKNFKKGDRVIAHGQGLGSGQAKHGTFQHIISCGEHSVSIIPSSISFTEGTVLPLAISTAAAGLYQKTDLALPLPAVGKPQPSGKIIVVWGASSSVGSVAVQLARQSGVDTIGVASKHNHSFVEKLGATKVFDYNSSSVVSDIVAAVKESGKEFAGIYDAIFLEPSLKADAEIIAQIGGSKKVTGVLPGMEKQLPEHVEGTSVFAFTIFNQHKEIGDAVWGKFVPEALKSGDLKALPEPLVVGKGLESIWKGLEKNKEGVSAKKVVIEL